MTRLPFPPASDLPGEARRRLSVIDGLTPGPEPDPVPTPGPTLLLFDNGLSSGSQRNTANVPMFQEVFEDFRLSQDSRITTIEWQQHDQPGATYRNTEVLIFRGLPHRSSTVFRATIRGSRQRNQTAPFGSWNGFDYRISGLAIDLEAGTYWLGLNSRLRNGRSGWDNTNGGADTIAGSRLVRRPPGPGTPQPHNHAFRLRGQIP